MHLLNEGGLYKMDKIKKAFINEPQFITSLTTTDAVGYINATGHQ